MRIETERLNIVDLEPCYFEAYKNEFTEKITLYQFPEPFADFESAKEVLSGFIADMKKGEMLELAILSKDNQFLGSMEAFGVAGDTPEIGIWLKESCQQKGYVYEALNVFVDYLFEHNNYAFLVYEVDIRNQGSINLVEKFKNEKGGFEEFITPSGKKLQLQTYKILR